jgi:hypothetical protein
MSTKKHIDYEVEQTLKALNKIERAKTDDFFYSRLMARMEHQQQSPGQRNSFEFGFALAAASIMIIASLNLLSISAYSSNTLQQEADATYVLEDFTADYQVFELNYYNTFEEE